MKRHDSMRMFVFLLAGALAAQGSMATDWPQWGGPERNAAAPAEGIFSGEIALEERWRREVGGGISALVVSGDRIFSLASVELEDQAFALDAATGEELWRIELGKREKELTFGAASTPATDGETVYLLSPGCHLMAVTAAEGRILWRRALKEEYETGAMRSGCWTSPLLAGGFLVVQVNGEPDKRLVAFDPATGEERWASAGTERSVRASPALASIGGSKQVVVHERNREGRGGLYAVALEDGRTLWTHRFEGAESYGYDTPSVWPGGRIGVVTWNDLRWVEVQRGEEDYTIADSWASEEIRAEVQPYNWRMVLYDGHLYGFGGDELKALDVADGEVLWREKIYPGSLILVDGHLVVLSQAAGLLRIVEASPEGYREKVELEVFAPGAPTDTPPTFADGRIYLRNSEEMVAFDVVSESAAEPTGAR